MNNDCLEKNMKTVKEAQFFQLSRIMRQNTENIEIYPE